MSFGPSGPKSGNQGGGDFRTITCSKSNIITNQKQITSFVIIPTTHLFPLAGQWGSRGVSIRVNLIMKYGLYDKVIKACYSA